HRVGRNRSSSVRARVRRRRHLGRDRGGSAARRRLLQSPGVAAGRVGLPPNGLRDLDALPRLRLAPLTPGVTARPRIFHGWWIVATAFVCLGVNVGLMFYAWSVFLTPLAAEFGGRGPVALGYSCTQFATAAYGLVVGRIVDRRGARPVETFGACVMALGFLMLSRVHTLPALYACLAGPVALGSTCVGALPNNTAVARWFVARRGRA